MYVCFFYAVVSYKLKLKDIVMKMTLEGTPSEINELLEILSTVVKEETVETVEAVKELDGYDVVQYEPTYNRYSLNSVYNGYRIYFSGTYYKFYKGPSFNDSSELYGHLDGVQMEIDDSIKRMNR